jgi:hypothetical protein
MPISCEPGEPIRLVLPADQNREPQPSFRFRALTVRESRKLSRIEAQVNNISRASDPADADRLIDTLVETLRSHLGGWELWDADGEPISYNPERIEDVLTLAEMLILLRMLQMGGLMAGDLKNSERPSPSPAGSCVAAAETAGAS